MKTFYFKIESTGYIEAEDEDEVREILENEKVWNLDNLEIDVKLDSNYTKNELGYYGLSQSDFI
jgi:hypothetical protein